MVRTAKQPRLESGDRLSRDEFHRRYCDLPDVRAELVHGVVYVSSPTRYGSHDEPQMAVSDWLSAYARGHEGVRRGLNATLLLDPETEVQPDGMLFREPAPPGGARVNAADYVEGAPQLVVEVAASSASYDLHDKLRAYERAGVAEYVVWRALDGRIDWFRLQDGAYVRVEPDAEGIVESAAYPGLRLHLEKMVAGDMAGVLAALEA